MSQRLLAAAIVSLAAATSQAAPIIYTETATISGSLNDAGFSNNVITITGFTSTANIFPSGCCSIATLNLSFSVSDVGSGTFTDSTRVVANRSVGSAGFSDINLNRAILFTSSPAFSTYDLSTSIGPIVGTAVLNAGFSFPTSAGPLIIYAASDSTFTAVTVVPLPAAAWLLGSALGLLAWTRRKSIS
jgi:hypothetical protein